MVLIGIVPKGSFFLIRNGKEGQVRKGSKDGPQGLQGAGGFDGGAGFGNHQEKDPAFSSKAPALALYFLCQLQKAMGIHILPCEKDLGKSLALFPAHHVPVGAAEHVEKHLVSQIGTADADGNQDIRCFGQFMDMGKMLPFFFGHEPFFLQNIGQTWKKDQAAVGSFSAFTEFCQ